MKTPTIEELNDMTEDAFQDIVRRAVKELDKDEQPKNREELDLIWFVGGYGGAVYKAIRERGITTIDELLEAKKKDPAIVQKIARTAVEQAYPTHYAKKSA